MSTVAEAPKKTLTIRDHLNSEGMKNHLKMALPKHVTPERMVRVALTAMTRIPKLAECDQASFFQCLFQCSQWGLEPDGRRAHLIPFENKRKGIVECQLIIDYKGLAELAYRSGIVKSINAMEIREGDIFEYDCGNVTKHVPHFLRRDPGKPAKSGEVFAYYAAAVMQDGAVATQVMSLDEVNAIRDKSQGYQSFKKGYAKSSIWVDHPHEMGKKGLAVDTPIPTPTGWSTMGQLQVGDVVFDMHGQRTKILAVSEVKHIDCFRLQFADGESITCDDEHRWCARIDGVGRPEWPVHTVNELFAAKRVGLPVSMPVAGSLQLDDADLAIDPWLLGYWLGNGRADGASLTCDSDDVDHVAASISQFSIGTRRRDTRSRSVAVGVTNGFKVALRASRLLENKHIPSQYLRASHNQRLRLLQGLMDSDGHIDKSRGRAIFEQTREDLSVQVCELLASLGEKCAVKKYVRRGYGVSADTYRIQWQPVHCPVSIPRKVASFHQRSIKAYRGVESIVRTVTVPTKCIAVDSPTETYLAGRSMIPTHNTVFKRLSKWLPLSADFRSAVDHDDAEYIEHSEPATRTVDSISGLLANDDAPEVTSSVIEPDGEIPAWDGEHTETRFAGCRTVEEVTALANELCAAYPDQLSAVSGMEDAAKTMVASKKKTKGDGKLPMGG